jgi:non-hemolytic enterotoxin B/C
MTSTSTTGTDTLAQWVGNYTQTTYAPWAQPPSLSIQDNGSAGLQVLLDNNVINDWAYNPANAQLTWTGTGGNWSLASLTFAVNSSGLLGFSGNLEVGINGNDLKNETGTFSGTATPSSGNVTPSSGNVTPSSGNVTPSSGQVQAAQQINTANQQQSSQALIIQNYCNSVGEQPNVDFSGEPNLAQYQTQINSGLATAQSHANNYLNTIQPSIIQNIANIGNYYALHNAVLTTLPEGSTEAQWTTDLTVLQSQSQQYQNDANGVVTSLQTLHDNMSKDSASFGKTVSELNAAVSGDDGVLDSLNSELSTVQKQIDGAIAGTVLSGLAIVGGAFLTAVGAVEDFVTAGASTPLVIAGVAIVCAGIGGETGSAIVLKNLNDEKANLLREESSLKAEVKLATGISGGYQSLTSQVNSAINAASQMENAWNSLSSDLGNLISDLNTGIKSADQVRTLWLAASNTEIQTVLNDVNTIKGQMAGVTSIVASPGQTVGDAIVAAVQSSAS